MPDDQVVFSKADWLAELSDRARAMGDIHRADQLLMLAWMAYDGYEVDPRGIPTAVKIASKASSAA